MAQVSKLERIYNTLEESQWWPRERLEESQRIELTRLVGHARSTSPFYSTRLDCLFRPNGSIDWDRWVDIPIMTRAELSHKRATIESSRPIHAHGPFGIVKTSGSTGDPVEFLVTRMMNDLSVASLWRGQKWAKMDWSGTMIHMGPESSKFKTGDSMGPWGPPWLRAAAKGKRLFATYRLGHADRIDLIRKHRAEYASFAGGMANDFAEYLRATKENVRLKTAQFVGGIANEYIRKEFCELLKADIVELYSSKEGGSMAHPCPMGHGWHQNAESVLLEIVDDDGKPVEPGRMGRVVITPFGNTSTPLIRYDQGDTAIAGSIETCACGRTLPCISAFSGRIRHQFRRPNGEFVLPLNVEARVQLGAGVWQVARVAEHSFELRYKKRDWGVQPNVDEFSKSFFHCYYPEAQLKIIEVKDFVLGPTGKHMELLDEWDPASQLGN